jgi:hypothetical protein
VGVCNAAVARWFPFTVIFRFLGDYCRSSLRCHGAGHAANPVAAGAAGSTGISGIGFAFGRGDYPSGSGRPTCSVSQARSRRLGQSSDRDASQRQIRGDKEQVRGADETAYRQRSCPSKRATRRRLGAATSFRARGPHAPAGLLPAGPLPTARLWRAAAWYLWWLGRLPRPVSLLPVVRTPRAFSVIARGGFITVELRDDGTKTELWRLLMFTPHWSEPCCA